MTALLFIVGLVFLITGAEVLVRGSSRLASALGISPLIIGLTIVAFGTSSPELAVSIQSALAGQAGIAVGNVVGSNIFNILFILGLSAIIVPLFVSEQLVRLEVPLLIVLSILVWLFSLNGIFGRTEGILLVAGLVLYFCYLFYLNRKEEDNKAAGKAYVLEEGEMPQPEGKHTKNWVVNLVLMAIGLALLILGSRWLVDSAVSFAQHLGASDLIIGLTIVAAGTSFPEVVTSIIAAVRGERDIAVGNIIGSNIFNIMAVLGITGILAPGGIEVSAPAIHFDIPIMAAVAFICLPMFFTGGMISRWEGVVLTAYYLAYLCYLILAASQHAAVASFGKAMLYFVIPLTVLTITVIAIREFRRRR